MALSASLSPLILCFNLFFKLKLLPLSTTHRAMTFLLSKLNYSAPLFICSPAPFVPIETNASFPSEPKTCAHKTGDPGNRGAITLCLYLGLCEMTETHFQQCDLEGKAE